MPVIFDQLSRSCSKLTTKKYSTSFSSAIRLLDKELRGPVYDIYGFVRFADEIVDSFHAFDKHVLFRQFKQDTFRAIQTGISLNPILNSFQSTVTRFSVDHSLITAFFDSMEMDLEKKHYDAEQYSAYIFGSAEAVGLMCLHIFCNGDSARYEQLKPGARSLGAAFQKINFLRDLKADHEDLNRTYFPGVNFSRFTKADKAVIEEDISSDLAAAFTAIMHLPMTCRFGVYLAYKYYKSLFRKIQKAEPSKLLQRRIRISNSFKAIIFLKAGLRSSFNFLS